jgi:hypothetical protein
MNQIEFDIAEVLEYNDTYQYIDPAQANTNVGNLFSIKVRSCLHYFNKKPFIVRPGTANIKQIPLVGEIVLIYRTFNQASDSTQKRESWYYLQTLNINSSTNANLLPGLSGGKTQTEIDNTKPGKTFQLKTVSPLQPYEGDVIIEGRNGNSIRFSNTISTGGSYYKSALWNGTVSTESTATDPIIILSNGRKNLTDRKFVTEDIQTDASSLYLTSTQKLTNFKLNNTIRQGKKSESDFSNSQLIGVADRITLKSKQDVIVLDSEFAIELNAPTLSIGLKKEKEPGLHSTAVIKLFKLFIQLMNGGLLDSSGVPVTADPTILSQIRSELKRAKNKNINQDTF